jgi:UDP-N-acetyl-D-mannosaminuronic acid dehydrogenase
MKPGPRSRGNVSTGKFTQNVGVIGGCGHVGLPLALIFADSGLSTMIYDINAATVEEVRHGRMPFFEDDAQEVLDRVLAAGKLAVSAEPAALAGCEFLVLIIGTPVDEHLNPTFRAIEKAVESCLPYLADGQVLVLRSTVFPGISQYIQGVLDRHGVDVRVAFCPERVAQGQSLREFRTLPQIVSAFEPETVERVKRLFGRFTAEFVEMAPAEAELCKLMTNAWRYIQFATVNQFYMVATQQGLDFDRILHGCRHHYPRMAGMPGPGFAAGPCLVKDTMQLAAYSRNTFVLGHAAMLVNEGLPAHLVELAKRQADLTKETVGILGMAFKAESDDPRDSLAYKLRKLLRLEAREVLCTDPYVKDPTLVPLERVLAEATVLFVATPHKIYRELTVPAGCKVVDVWSCLPAVSAIP